MSDPMNNMGEILADETGKYWGEQRQRLQAIALELSQDMTLEKLKFLASRVKGYGEKGAPEYAFGYAVLSEALKPHAKAPWVSQAYRFLLDSLAAVPEENDRTIALVGNAFWPGFVEGIPREASVPWVLEIYRRCLEIVSQIEDESMKSVGLARISWHLGETVSPDWVPEYYNSLVDLAFDMSDNKERAEALSGLAKGLGEWGSADWAGQLVGTLLEKARELPEEPQDSTGDSPRSILLQGITQALGESGGGIWVPKVAADLLVVVGQITDREKASLFEETAKAATAMGTDRIANSLLDSLFKALEQIRDDEVRANAIGKFASGLAEAVPSSDLGPLFNRLIKNARKIRSEEARADAFSGAAYSVAVALAELSEQDWARARLESLQRMARTFRSQEYRAEFLGGLTEALEESPNAEWAKGYCRRIVKIARAIRGEEARSTALESIARGVGQLEGVSWRQPLIREIFDIAKRIRDENERVMALCSICEEVASASSDPWVGALALDALAYINEEVEVPRAFGLQHMGSDVLPEIREVNAAEQLATAMTQRVFALDNNTIRAMALGGVVEGLQKMSHAKLKRKLLFSVTQRIKEIRDDEDRALAIVGFVHGIGEIGSKIQKESWAKELFVELIKATNNIKDDLLRLGVIGGGLLDLGPDFTSIAVALGHIADADWGDVYGSCVRIAGNLTMLAARLTAYSLILEHGFGDPTLKEELKEATWLRSIYLNCLEEIGEGIAKNGGELEDNDRASLKEAVAKRIHFLRTYLDEQEIAARQELPDRRELYDRLLDSVSGFSEETYTEKDVFTEDIRYTIIPRAALLETLSTDFVLEEPEWARQFLRRLLDSVGSLRNLTAREMVYRVMAESFFLSPDEAFVRECTDQLLTSTQIDTQVHPAASIALVRAYVGRGLRDSALEIALKIGEPSTRLQALRELALVFKGEVPRALRETLEQLVDVEERIAILDGRLHDPEYKDENPDKYPYDVAISFAGPDKEHAEQLHRALLANNLRVFYYADPVRQAELWGEDGYRKLYEVFNSQALYCLILISKHYVERKWTLHELRAAQARQLESKEAYILPAKLDETELPGEAPTRIYIDLREQSYEKIAAMLAARVLKSRLKRS